MLLWSLTSLVLFVVIVLIVIFKVIPNLDIREITIDLKSLKMSIKSEKNKINYQGLLRELMDDSDANRFILSFLAERNIYPVDSEELVGAIKTKLCKSFPEGDRIERLNAASQCANKPVVKRLRDLAYRTREPPFHYVGELAKAGIQADPAHQPRQGRANVCREGIYVGKRVEVHNLNANTMIVVEASGTYPCTGVGDYPVIQLHPDDARELIPNRPFNKYEEVTLVIL